ncbi:DNA cytosine methyltransferase [Nonomuraea sp. NPDC049480]|uniref:DNA cytosine methyltransferase n=1 Tax=Nonomuraea sp. NPDC049480 TaxID=3364353 RepID=UPI0037B042B6
MIDRDERTVVGESRNTLKSLEICAGAGGQALGLERAGFEHVMLIENDRDACNTLRLNRPSWDVVEIDLREFDSTTEPHLTGIDLVAGGVPCTPYSIAGHQRGNQDPRDLLPVALDIVEKLQPRAVMIENVAQLLRSNKFALTREATEKRLLSLGYHTTWNLLNARDYGVPQHRERTVLVALTFEDFPLFEWPSPEASPPTVGDVLLPSMSSKGWRGAVQWAARANSVAPTVVGGSKIHGGPDLGPDRAKTAWSRLGVNGNSLANDVPESDFVLQEGLGRKGRYGLPKLTIEQVALVQGFPPDWIFTGKKTPRYKQVGNAFPPPVAEAVGRAIAAALTQDP